MFSRAAVHSAWFVYIALPSPISATTGRFGSPSFTPIAAGRPQPMPPPRIPKKLLGSAHLKNVREDLMIGQAVKAGELLALMGRTTNTREGISRDRAHVHFELDLLINDRFPAWFRKASPAQRNDHGAWNGQNLLGLDPRLIFLEEGRQTTNFSLLNFIGHQTELCRVFVRATRFPWLTRYPSLVQGNPLAGTEGVAGYEISLNYNGVPFRLIPRAASEVQGRSRFELLSVDEGENRRNPCRGLVVKRGGRWRLGHNGEKLLELLTF